MATHHSSFEPQRLPQRPLPPITHRLRTRPDTPWCRVESQIFDDALADGATIHAAGRRAGRTAAEAERQFARICAKLGDQAQ